MKHRNAGHGFTLIELLIVVVIVGILALAAIPIISSSADDAQAAEGQALAGSVMNAAKTRLLNAEYGLHDMPEGTDPDTDWGMPSPQTTAGDWSVSSIALTDSGSSAVITVTADYANGTTTQDKIGTFTWTRATNAQTWDVVPAS